LLADRKVHGDMQKGILCDIVSGLGFRGRNGGNGCVFIREDVEVFGVRVHPLCCEGLNGFHRRLLGVLGIRATKETAHISLVGRKHGSMLGQNGRL